MESLPQPLREAVKVLEEQFTVSTEKLKTITDHFVSELEKGMVLYDPIRNVKMRIVKLISR
jgi:hexokinase